MNGEAPGVAGGMDAAAMERAFLMELCTEGGVGGVMHLGPQVMLLLVGHRQTEPHWARQAALCERQGTDLMLSSVHLFFF